MMIFTSFLATLPICRTNLFCVFCPPSPLPVSFLSKPRSLFAPHACSVPDLLFAFHGVCRRHPSMLISHWLATCCLSGSPGSFPLLLSCSGFFSEVLRMYLLHRVPPSLFLFFKLSLLSLPHPIFCTCFLHRANKFFLLFGTIMGELRLEISHSLSPNEGTSFLSLFVAPSHFLPSPPPASLFVALIPFVFSPTLPFCRSSANAPTSMHPIFAAKTKLLQRQIRKLFAYISPFIFILLC